MNQQRTEDISQQQVDPDRLRAWLRYHDRIEQRTERPLSNRARWIAAALIGAALVGSVLLSSKAHAQTGCSAGGPSTCFVASKTTGESPMATTLTWNVLNTSTCSAAGIAPWSGTVAPSGTRNLTGITAKMTLTLDCSAPGGNTKVLLSWTPPTQNTDGSTLSNLGGYLIEYGTSASSLTQTLTVPVPGATAYTMDALTPGTWFFALKVRTSGCFPIVGVTCYESARSTVVNRAVTAIPGGNLPQLSVTLEPYTVPKPVTGLTATDATAMEIKPNASGELVASRVGLVPIGTRCYEDERVAAGVSYHGVPIALVDFVNWPSVQNLREAWAKCG